MKHLKHIILILIIGIFFSFHQNENIVGKWKIDKYEINNVKLEKVTNKWIKFINNGKLEGGDLTNQIRKTGTWKIDDKNKKIIILSEEASKDDGEYTFEFLNSNNLILTKDSLKVFMIKTY